MKYLSNLKKIVKGIILLNEPLSKHTTFRIGGSARVWIEPKDKDDLKKVLGFIKKNKIPFFVIGQGSNVLIGDNGFRGIVVKLNSDFFKKIDKNGDSIKVGAGLSLGKLLEYAKDKSLGGCEFLAGIPGSIGGALAMNAGARINSVLNNHYKSIGDLVNWVEVVDFNGGIKKLKKSSIVFKYRYSNLDKYVIISANIKLKHKDRSRIKQEIRNFLEYKKKTQELNRASAGCVFKNPRVLSNDGSVSELLSAGYLIDSLGLKGYRRGGAVVSKKHANYIINKNKASAKDVINIIKFVQKRIKNKFNITLEPEIKLL